MMADENSHRNPVWLRIGRVVFWPMLIAVFGFGLTIRQIDPGGDLPAWPEGPGLTLDEGFYVEGGIRLVVGLQEWGKGTLTWQEVFGEKDDLGSNPPLGYYLPDHPPLGRIWLGLWHQNLSWDEDQTDASPRVVIAKSRVGSAAAFGLLILLIGITTTRWYGPFAGAMAALSLILMPRVFAHAHLAALETITNFVYAAAVLAIASWWKRPDNNRTKPMPAPAWKLAALAGLVWGIALLTKIQAGLIGPPVVLWAFWHWRFKAVLPLFVWGMTGLLVFFVGWPWLWLDPVDHSLHYFQNAADRVTLYVWYLGQRFADVQTPWHYPFVMLLITMPVGFLVWGVCGVCASDENQGKLQLVLATAGFPLLLFAISRVAVYDGVRLFLVSYPLLAIPIGRGAALSWGWLTNRAGPKLAGVVFGIVLAAPSFTLWTLSPCYLNSYNWLIGGLAGAERLGMETNYWGDSLTRDFWNEVANTIPEGSVVHVSPVVHPLQLAFLKSQLPQLRERNITLKACVPEQIDEARFLVVFDRKADLPPPIEKAIAKWPAQIEVKRQGVRLGGFYRRER